MLQDTFQHITGNSFWNARCIEPFPPSDEASLLKQQYRHTKHSLPCMPCRCSFGLSANLEEERLRAELHQTAHWNGAFTKHEPRRLDCSQSPYFSVGFSRPVRFDGTAAILVCKSERDLRRVSKLPRGAEVGVSIVGDGKRKNRGTPLEHETVRTCYSLPFFPAASQLRSPPPPPPPPPPPR